MVVLIIMHQKQIVLAPENGLHHSECHLGLAPWRTCRCLNNSDVVGYSKTSPAPGQNKSKQTFQVALKGTFMKSFFFLGRSQTV